MKSTILSILLSGLYFISHGQSNKLNKLKWLQGYWIMATDNMQFTEYWVVVNDILWQGAGYGTNSKGDTVFKENLQIALQNYTVWYLPTIGNQNNGKQVRFAARELTGRNAVFENMQHDFPQRIVYNKTSDSTIYAYVEGIQKGKMRKEEFHFKRK